MRSVAPVFITWICWSKGSSLGVGGESASSVPLEPLQVEAQEGMMMGLFPPEEMKAVVVRAKGYQVAMRVVEGE